MIAVTTEYDWLCRVCGDVVDPDEAISHFKNQHGFRPFDGGENLLIEGIAIEDSEHKSTGEGE